MEALSSPDYNILHFRETASEPEFGIGRFWFHSIRVSDMLLPLYLLQTELEVWNLNYVSTVEIVKIGIVNINVRFSALWLFYLI